MTPVAPTASFAIRSVTGSSVERCVFETCSGCFSATSSMSIPPMSLKITTGSLRRPSQVTAAKYSCATRLFSSTSTPIARCPFTTIGRICSKARAACSGVSANLTAPAFMRPPESTWLLSTTGPPISPAIRLASRRRLREPALAEREAMAREERLRLVLVEAHGDLAGSRRTRRKLAESNGFSPCEQARDGNARAPASMRAQEGIPMKSIIAALVLIALALSLRRLSRRRRRRAGGSRDRRGGRGHGSRRARMPPRSR